MLYVDFEDEKIVGIGCGSDNVLQAMRGGVQGDKVLEA